MMIEAGVSVDQLAYRSLADQISIAIENARAYAIERETVRRLQATIRCSAAIGPMERPGPLSLMT